MQMVTLDFKLIIFGEYAMTLGVNDQVLGKDCYIQRVIHHSLRDLLRQDL